MNIEDSLRLALMAERHTHRKDNEYLLGEIDRLREAFREVVGACAPPVESLLAVHGDGKYISPGALEGLAAAAAALRKNLPLISAESSPACSADPKEQT